MKYIFVGAGSVAENLYNKLQLIEPEIDILAVLDNNSSKIGNSFLNIIIDKVENIYEYFEKDVKIIITSSYYKEIEVQLKQLKINLFLNYLEFENILDKEILRKNRQLEKNKDRVFIIGNGPSLKSLDLNRLKDEDTIMVNHIYRSEDLLKIEPKYWIVADPAFWSDENDYLEKINRTLYQRLNKTSFLININAMYQNKFRPLHNNLLVYLYKLDKTKNELFSNDQISFAEPLPKFAQNVISTALMLALYLEYKQIILIGCDQSWWNLSKEDFDSGLTHSHYYKNTQKQVEHNKKVFKQYGYEGLMATVERQKFEYLTLRNYAEKKNIKIINSTVGGYLDCFERKDYITLF